MDSSIDAIYELSPLQQGMLFHSIQSPSSGIYIIQVCCSIHSKIDSVAFEQTWQSLIERHSILRTAFVWKQLNQMYQVVHNTVRLPLKQYDWRGLSTAQQQAQLVEFMRADRLQDFELTNAPLMRLSLIRFGQNEYQMIWTHHNILLDGWSISLILREFFIIYQSFLRKEQSGLDAPSPFQDYITWLQEQNLVNAEEYWRHVLQGFNNPTSVNLFEVENSLQETGVGDLQICLSEAESLNLKRWAQQHHLTLSTVLTGAWTLMLSHYTNEKDIVFGIVVSGRQAAVKTIESITGLLTNTLPIRIQIHPQSSLLMWLSDLQNKQAEMRQYEYSPLTLIQRASEVPRGTPLFESIVVIENYPLDFQMFDKYAEELSIQDIQVFEQTNYPLVFTVGLAAKVTLKITYKKEYFHPDVILRMLDYIRTLIVTVSISNPNELLSKALFLQTEREQVASNQIISSIKDLRTTYSEHATIPQLFIKQAHLTPDAIAIIDGKQLISYDCLNKSTNKLARLLLDLGAVPEQLVVVMVDRGIPLINTIIGIMKSRAAYVPIDPNYPIERIRYILENSSCTVIVTTSKYLKFILENLPSKVKSVLCLDSNEKNDCVKNGVQIFGKSAVEVESENDIELNCSGNNLAYIIYTSGSTGKPKGVMITHQAVLNTFFWLQSTFELTPDDVIAQKTSSAFTDSVWELLWPLSFGSKFVVLDDASVKDPNELYRALRDYDVTITQFVPAQMNSFLHSFESKKAENPLPHLKWVFNGGEDLPVSIAREWYKVFCSAKIANIYGMTESAIYATSCFLEEAPRAEDLSVPVGKPISNAEVYILNQDGQLCPPFVIGEICIGGVGIARGYLDRPELTAERFVPNLFNGQYGSRLYKTGDIGYYRSDGVIDYCGRMDNQVKIRGFRVELGEVEACLSQYPGVCQTVVCAIEIKAGYKQLIAYIVSTRETKINATEINRFLKKRLPEYMIPSFYIELQSFPLTPNGKIDRKVLPLPSQVRPVLTNTYVGPQSSHEKILTKIWTEILGIEAVGIHDNFFELGGDSLLATQVISLIYKHFQVELSLQILFKQPTIATLAKIIAIEELGGEKELSRILDDLENMSDDEAKADLENYFNKGK